MNTIIYNMNIYIFIDIFHENILHAEQLSFTCNPVYKQQYI